MSKSIPNTNVKPWVLVVLLTVFAGCKPSLLPSTNLKDNGENRALVTFMLEYKGAIEKRDADAVMKLVAKDYFEDNGNLEQEDDYGYEGLRDKLISRFEHLKAVRLDLFIQNSNEDKGKVYVDYRYQQRSLITLPAGKVGYHTPTLTGSPSAKKATATKEGFEVVSGL